MFHSARLKLTAWYLLFIMLISLFFTVVIYRGLTSELERFARMQRFRIERRLYTDAYAHLPSNLPPVIELELIEETKKRLMLVLAGINGGILIFFGGMGYFLAGRTLRPIQEMVDEQNQFISDSSHELRTPLTSLKSSMEVYLRDRHPTMKEAKSLMGESIDEVNKLQQLSESLLQLAQYQKPDGYALFEKLFLVDVVNQVLSKIEPLAIKKQITIRSKVKHIEIEGNKYGLVDLLVLLLDNAIKYSRPKSRIEITGEKTDGLVFLAVKDQGIGIDEKDINHIFDRFYRADSARMKTSEGGYGLGLSIAKRIVDVHKGTIHVSSTVGKGTTFTVKLPIHQGSRVTSVI